MGRKTKLAKAIEVYDLLNLVRQPTRRRRTQQSIDAEAQSYRDGMKRIDRRRNHWYRYVERSKSMDDFEVRKVHAEAGLDRLRVQWKALCDRLRLLCEYDRHWFLGDWGLWEQEPSERPAGWNKLSGWQLRPPYQK